MDTQCSVLVPTEELELIRIAQLHETTWWQGYPVMSTTSDINHQVDSGTATRLPQARRAVYSQHGNPLYKVSSNVPRQFWVLGLPAFRALECVAISWHNRMRETGVDPRDLFLVVTSLSRTIEYQQKLVTDGYPAVETNGTHTKLGAFDIGFRWFVEHDRRDALGALDLVPGRLHLAHRINWIREDSVGVYHVAANPAYWTE